VSEEQTAAVPQAPSAGLPDDANDLRGFHFRRLLGKPATWIATAIFVLVAGTAGAVYFSAAIGAGAAVAALIVSLLIVFAIADSRSEGDFFTVYATQRGMSLSGRGPLPPMTPLLRKGDDRYADDSFTGPLAEGVDGVLALYTYEEETSDGKGGRETNYYRYTVGLVEVSECAARVPELFCQHRVGLHALEGLEDAFRRSKQRVKLESEALDERYEIFSGEGQDQVWLRRLFSPTFVVWLGEEAPQKFAFELVAGYLCCYVKGHKKSATELDVVRAATATVARRLREESQETGTASSAPGQPR
jgi:hypothetical protein